MDIKKTEALIIERLKEVYDPEIPANIYEIGLIYEINIGDNGKVHILMTLTSPNCPVAESLPLEVKYKVETVEEVTVAEVELTFDPPWDESMLTDEAKLELGML
ncbi:MAG: iron-sulfur cluster assembly protein [Bacteroidota bacterium]